MLFRRRIFKLEFSSMDYDNITKHQNQPKTKLPPLIYPILPLVDDNDNKETDSKEELKPVLPESHGSTLPQLSSRIIPEWKPLPPLRYDPSNQDKNSLITVNKRQTWLAWSIITTIIFLPFFFFWIPALVCSLKAKKRFRQNDHESGKKLANTSLILNVTCLFVGVICYILAIALPLILIKSTNIYSCDSSDLNCYEFCREENSAYSYNGNIYYTYWTCYEDEADYMTYSDEIRYLYCKRAFTSWNTKAFVCKNEEID